MILHCKLIFVNVVSSNKKFYLCKCWQKCLFGRIFAPKINEDVKSKQK